MTTRGQIRAQAVAVTIACACASASLALVCHGLNARWWLPLAGGIVAAGLAAVEEMRHGARSSVVVAGFRASCWLTGGSFVAWVAANSYTPTTWEVWTVGAVLFGMAACALPTAAEEAQRGPAPDQAPVAPAEMQEVLADAAGIKHAEVGQPVPWPGGAGYDVAARITGRSGMGWQDVKRVETNIGNALDLPTGCGVEVQPGPSKRQFLLRVSTRDVLAVTRDYVEHLGTSPLSINGLLPLGWKRDGLPVETTLRRVCMTVTAMTDGGKSNFLHTVTADLVRCPDVLVWHIDLAGAGLSLPWIADYRAGRADRPVVDWAATTVDEAILMVEMALQIILTRRAAYADLMAEHNTDVVPCSPDLPQIVIVVDETAEAAGETGDPALQSGLIRIIQMGRAVGVRVAMSLLRNVGTVLPTDAQSQIGARVLFGVADESEVGYALGWRVKLDLADAAHPGCGWWVSRPGAPIEVFRTPLTALPRTIAHIARECASRRPELDEPSARVPLGAHYVDRWTRTLAALGPGAHGAVDLGARAPLDAHPDAHPDAHLSAPPARRRGGIDLAGLDASIERAERATAREVAARNPDETFAAMTADLEGDILRGAAEHSDTDPQDRLMALLLTAGPAGLSGHRLHQLLVSEGFAISRDTVYQRLRKSAVDGGRGAYIHPQHRQDAP